MANGTPEITQVDDAAKIISPVVLPAESGVEEDLETDDDLTKDEGDVESEESEEVKVDGEDKEGEEEGEELEGSEEEKAEEGESTDDLISSQDVEIKELRKLAREGKRDNDQLLKQIDGLREKMKDAGILDEEDDEAQAAQAAEKRSVDERNALLEGLLETMKVNPKYEDVEDVCSKGHFEDLVDALAEYHVEQEGGDKRDAAIAAEEWIWSRPNPYKYLYDNIKAYHPDYVEVEGEDEEKVVRKAEAHKAPKSIGNMGGGSGSDKVGWTAAQIDALSEDDLENVPDEVYQLFLQGKLK